LTLVKTANHVDQRLHGLNMFRQTAANFRQIKFMLKLSRTFTLNSHIALVVKQSEICSHTVHSCIKKLR